jgi:predicted dehydrogenase
MERIGVGIIGSGYWGINYVRTLGELPGNPHVVVCDQRLERLDEVARRYPRVELSTEMDEVLRRRDVNAVVVCTPATTHYAVTSRCLAAGKHVLVEKPITTQSADAEKLIRAAAAQHLTLMVGHTFIHNPGIQKVKSYLDRGDAGRVYYLYARRTNMGPIRSDVNAIWDLAPHDISIFNYLMGRAPEWVSAVGAKVLQNGREDVGFISMGYAGGVIAHIHVSWSDPNKVRETVVVGSEKRIVFNDLNTQEPVRVYEKGVSTTAVEPSSFGEYQLQMRDGDIISPKVELGEPLKNQCRHFLQCVSENSRPLTSAWDGLEVVKVMEAIDRSLALYGAPVWVRAEARQTETVTAPEDREEVAADVAMVERDLEDAGYPRHLNGHNGQENGHSTNNHGATEG